MEIKNKYGVILHVYLAGDLRGADLRGANLRGAHLQDSDLHHPESVITPEGELHVWKKSIDGFLVKLLIPSDAKRCNATGRKCRASKAVVMEILGNTVARGRGGFLYELGKTVTPDSYDECRWNECSNGIHFFLTKEEAARYIP